MSSTSSSSGSIQHLRTPYAHEDLAFPTLGRPTTPSLSANVAVWQMKPTFASVLGQTTQPLKPSMPSTLPTTTMIRSENRLEMALCTLDDKLEKFQYEGAKHILSNLPPSTRNAWLKQLHHSLKHNVPMVSPTPPVKKYYKTYFRPIFTDAVPLSYADSNSGSIPDDAFRAPVFRKYNVWTDRALATYATMDFSPAFFQQKRRKIYRPSSQVHCRHRLPLPDSCPITQDATTIPHVNYQQRNSLHVFQFSTHSRQHETYCKALLDAPTFDYLTSRTPCTPTDTKGYHRTLQRSMLSQLEARLKYGLATTPMEHWDTLTSNLFTSWQLCLSLRPATDQSKTSPCTDIEPTFYCDYPIGLGLSHFSPKHRLHRRVHRAHRFFHFQQAQKWSIKCAPNSRQHLDTLSDVQFVGGNSSALIFQQHSLPFNSLSIPLFGPMEDSHSPVYISFVGDDPLKSLRAPPF